MTDNTFHSNVAQLWNYSDLTLVVNEAGELSAISDWNLIHRLIIWIKDYWTGGGETDKVRWLIFDMLTSIKELYNLDKFTASGEKESLKFFVRNIDSFDGKPGGTYYPYLEVVKLVEKKNPFQDTAEKHNFDWSDYSLPKVYSLTTDEFCWQDGVMPY